MSAGGVLGSDICQRGLQPDYITLTCSMRYHGNIAPTLLWNQEGVQGARPASANHVHIAEHFLITSTTVVQSSETMNGSYFICSASMNWNKNSTQEEKDLNITWTSPVINLLCKYYIYIMQHLLIIYLTLHYLTYNVLKQILVYKEQLDDELHYYLSEEFFYLTLIQIMFFFSFVQYKNSHNCFTLMRL